MEILGPALGSPLVRNTRPPHVSPLLTLDGAILGMDMAAAFVGALTSEEFATSTRIGIELSARNREDDEFAAIYGLPDCYPLQ